MSEELFGLLIVLLIIFCVYRVVKSINNESYEHTSSDNQLELANIIVKYAKLKISTCIYAIPGSCIFYCVNYPSGLKIDRMFSIYSDTYTVYFNTTKIATWTVENNKVNPDTLICLSMFNKEILKPYFEGL